MLKLIHKAQRVIHYAEITLFYLLYAFISHLHNESTDWDLMNIFIDYVSTGGNAITSIHLYIRLFPLELSDLWP